MFLIIDFLLSFNPPNIKFETKTEIEFRIWFNIEVISYSQDHNTTFQSLTIENVLIKVWSDRFTKLMQKTQT